MLLLIPRLTDRIAEVAEQYSVGILHSPRHFIADARGLPEAADNGCFAKWDEQGFRKYLKRLEGRPLLFCAAPDVVGNHSETLARWREWEPVLRAHKLPPAFVLQDGLRIDEIPFEECAAVFVGGTTEFKLGPAARTAVLEAKRRGLWAHMGRVNSKKRIEYAASIGCDSVDGTGFARYERDLLWGAKCATHAKAGVLVYNLDKEAVRQIADDRGTTALYLQDCLRRTYTMFVGLMRYRPIAPRKRI